MTNTGIYDDGATYGPDPEAEVEDIPAVPICDDGASYRGDLP